MVDLAKEHGARERTPTIDVLFMYRQLANRIGPRTPVLSGYFGGPISGQRLPPQSATDGPDLAVNRFIRNWMSAIDGTRVESLRAALRQFIVNAAHWQPQFHSLTFHDLLNFGLRQPQRIRPDITAAYANCITPYEDSRWVRYWLGRPLSDRLGQRLYEQTLVSAFPAVFSARPAGVTQKKRMQRPMLNLALMRGDPRVNKSMIRTLRQAAEAFDRRGLFPIKFLANADRLANDPSDVYYNRARWILSAEVHLRAGLL